MSASDIAPGAPQLDGAPNPCGRSSRTVTLRVQRPRPDRRLHRATGERLVLFVAPDGHTVGPAQHFCHRTAVVAPPDVAAVMVTVDAVAECGDRGTVAATRTVVAFFD